MFLHNLLNVLVQIENKMELPKKFNIWSVSYQRKICGSVCVSPLPLLGNGSVKTFPRHSIHTIIETIVGSVAVCLVDSAKGKQRLVPDRALNIHNQLNYFVGRIILKIEVWTLTIYKMEMQIL
jgi:hypothetical protein